VDRQGDRFFYKMPLDKLMEKNDTMRMEGINLR